MNSAICAFIAAVLGCGGALFAGAMSFANIFYRKNILPARSTLLASLPPIALAAVLWQQEANLFVNAYGGCLIIIGLCAPIVWLIATLYATKKLQLKTVDAYPHSPRLMIILIKYFSAGWLIAWVANLL